MIGAAMVKDTETGAGFARMALALSVLSDEVRQLSDRCVMQSLMMEAAVHFGGRPELAVTGARDAASQRLREIAIYLTCTRLSWTQERAAGPSGLTRPGVCRAVARVEDERDDPHFNWKLSLVEQLLEG